jgi:hypothetical protein
MPSLGCGGMAKVIGHERTNPRSRTQALRDRGCMPTCTARKAIRETLPIGTAGQANPFAESRWIQNGQGSLGIC